jgi:hypothetical protein
MAPTSRRGNVFCMAMSISNKTKGGRLALQFRNRSYRIVS